MSDANIWITCFSLTSMIYSASSISIKCFITGHEHILRWHGKRQMQWLQTKLPLGKSFHLIIIDGNHIVVVTTNCRWLLEIAFRTAHHSGYIYYVVSTWSQSGLNTKNAEISLEISAFSFALIINKNNKLCMVPEEDTHTSPNILIIKINIKHVY